MTRMTWGCAGRLNSPRLASRTATRRAADRRRRLILESLEERQVLNATLSGSVFQTFDASGLYSSPVTQTPSIPSSAFLNLVGGVVVTLDGATKATTGTSGTGLGTYQFSNVAAGSHTITIQTPAGYFGAGGQSLAATLVVQADQTTYPNLNFAITPTTAAVVQNLYQLVLNRSVSADELNQQVLALQAGGTTIGGVFSGLYNSADFNANSEPVAQVIESFFPGPLDVGALRNAVQLQALGVSQEAVVTQILYSSKFIKAFGDLSRLSDSNFVGSMYQNILGRNPKPAELKSWDAQLAGGLPRAGVALSLVNAREYEIRGRNDANQTAVSLAFVGVLGRQASASEQSYWVAKLRAGMSVKSMANALAATTEFKNLKGFTDSLIWDVNAHQIEPPVNDLNRLMQYDASPGKHQFDIPVAPGSITSTGESNVYFLVHGWAPGQTQPVLLQSTPGDPLKWWDSSDATWLLNPVADVSTEGLAQSIIDADPNAKVYAYSWIDESNTATSLNPTQTSVNAFVNKARNVVQVSSVARLAPGMTVVAPEVAPGTYITAINVAKNQITLSAKPVAFNPTATLTVLTSQITGAGSVTTGSAVVTGIDTRYLTTGMTVSGSGASIASIDSATQLTLSQPATTTGKTALTLTGLGTTVQTQQGTLQNGFPTIAGLDTSGLSTGMTVVGSNGDYLGTIATIDSSSQITMLPSATTTGPQTLIFKGADLRLLLEQNLYSGQSEAYTQTNGLRLSSTIEQALAPGFFTYGDTSGGGLIHLIGHSHGSKVATVATLALQQANVPVAQLTTLESPEAGPQLTEADVTINTHLPNLGGAQNFLWYYMRQMNLSRNPVATSRGSTSSTFIDNYFSTQGFGTALGAFRGLNAFGSNTKNDSLSNVVDAQMHPEILYGGVSLSNPSTAYPTLQGSHQYPAAWYGQASLRKAPAQSNGVNWSPLVNPSAAPSGDLYQQQTSVTRPATLIDKSTSVTGIDTTGLVKGMPVSDGSYFDSYIADGTTIYSIDSPTSLTLSKAAIGGGSDNLIFQVTAAAYVADDDAYQYTLTQGTQSSVTPNGPTPLNYVQQNTTGWVTDNGSSITLSVDPSHSQAIDAIGFNPLSAQGLTDLGAGMDLQVQFSGAAPGSQVQLVVWIHGLSSSPKVTGFPLGSTMGNISIPLLALDAGDVGSSVQYATLSLGQYLNAGFLRAPFNAVNTADAAAGTMTPTIAFSLIGDGASTVSVTVSNLRQFSDGVLFS